jgi:putative ABC transport system ATP-binding protein
MAQIILAEVSNMGFIRLVGLRKAYVEGERRRVVLEDACAEFERGEFVALLGRSGSGKSTLLNLVSGIDRPDAGQVWVGDRELTAMSERDRTLFRRHQIGFIFQFYNLISTLTVLENVTLPLELGGASSKAAKIAAEPLLDAVGLLDRARAYPDRLSGGEQQRVAIARALVHDPLIVLADEPTGNLDEDTGATVLENVTLPLELGGTSPKAARAAVEPLLDAVALLDRAATYPDRLSGGEQQRVAIARALAHDPLIVLADEPTGNLDEDTGRDVLALLDRLTRQAGKNLLMVTHSAEAASYADRVLRLHEGRLVA